MTDDTARKKRLSEAGVLLLILLSSLAFKICFLPFQEMITPDEGYYLRQGNYLSEGGVYGQFDFISVKHKGQPLLPYVFSLFSHTGWDPVQTGRWISIFVGLLTLIVFHLCARTFCSPREAFVSDFILAFSPFHIQASLWAMPHSFFLFFILGALYFIFRLEALKWRAAVLAGAMFWAAYLTRVEAFFFALGFGVILSIAGISSPDGTRRSGIKPALQMLATFFILCIPVFIWIYNETGIWQLTWTEGRGARGVFDLRWAGKLKGSPFTAENFLRNYLKFLKDAFELLPNILPLPVWIFSAAGTLEILRRDPSQALRCLRTFFLAVIPLFFYPAYAALDPRFFSPVLMLAILPAGAAMQPVKKAWIALTQSIPGKKEINKFSRLLIFPFILLMFLSGYFSLVMGYREEAQEQKKAGEWLAKNRHDSFVFLGTDQRACFYAGAHCRKIIPLRYAVEAWENKGISLDKFLDLQGISAIAFDSRYGKKFYPQFEKWFQALPAEQLREEWRGEEKGEWIILYQWMGPSGQLPLSQVEGK